MKILNLTPDTLNIINDFGAILKIPASGQIARCAQSERFMGILPNAIPVTKQEFGEVEGLPAPELETILVVSRMVAKQIKDRADVYVPGPLVRDDDGRVVGYRGLSTLYV